MRNVHAIRVTDDTLRTTSAIRVSAVVKGHFTMPRAGIRHRAVDRAPQGHRGAFCWLVAICRRLLRKQTLRPMGSRPGACTDGGSPPPSPPRALRNRYCLHFTLWRPDLRALLTSAKQLPRCDLAVVHRWSYPIRDITNAMEWLVQERFVLQARPRARK